jgi:N-acetylated-alpha-linked acidic dipeptidase
MHWPKSWFTPFPQERIFWDGFDADYLFDFASRLSRIGAYELGFRPSGSKAGHRAGDLILEEMRRLGLQDVHKEPFPVYAWDFAGASLQLEGWDPMPASSYPPTPGTSPEGLSAMLVDAGHGTAPDYLGLDVRGKIAFVRFDTKRLPWVDVLAHEAELHGARALAFYYLNGYAQHESGQALNTHDGTARPTIPILQLCKRDGARVAARLSPPKSARREAEGPVRATLRSQVKTNPEGTGHNVIGRFPGRQADCYLIVGAHYDAWFHGYWDNAVGVAGMLAIAKTLLDHGYQSEHTLLFIATDAEEFGAPDTHFDWLIGCHRMLGAHPEWRGRVSAAFNIDTLSFLAQEQLSFIGPPELLPFLREAAGGYEAKTFPQPRVCVKEQVTAWTEVLTYAYFGIPPIQPRFALEEARRTIYHTQFDTADIVHHERAAETIQLYGTLLVRLDRQPILPYEFTERVRSLRATIKSPPPVGVGLAPALEEELAGLRRALDRLEGQAGRLNLALIQASETEPGQARAAMNDRLRQAAAHVIAHTNYLDATAPEDALPLHTFYDRDLRALDAALAHLAAGDPEQAMAALADRKTGLHGAWCALDMSYRVHYRHTVGGRNPGRGDLFWGQGRTAMITDVWAELHTLKDKMARGVTDFEAEAYALQGKRETVAVAYRDAIRDLTGVIEEATAMLPLSNL